MSVRLAVLLALFGLALPARAATQPLKLWHAYRGDEEKALQQSVDVFTKQTGIRVELLPLPYQAFASKLESAIPHGNGPDVFIFAHERLRSFHRHGMVAPSTGDIDPSRYIPTSIQALRIGQTTYGYPLALKCVALYLNTRLVDTPPTNTTQLLALLGRLSDAKRNQFGLAYQSGEPYYHMPFLFGFGGKLFGPDGKAVFDTAAMARSLAFVKGMQDRGEIPQEDTGALVKSLFNSGKAAMVIDGPWFAGEIAPGISYRVVALPTVSATGQPLRPFLGVEAAFVSAKSTQKANARKLARFLSLDRSAVIRATVGRQVPAALKAYDDAAIRNDPLLSAFREASKKATPMPNTLEMSRVWEPMKLALRAVLQGEVTPEGAGALASRRYRALNRPAPPPASGTPYVLILLVCGLGAAGWTGWRWRKTRDTKPFAKRYPDFARAMAYVTPAAAGMLVLVVVPFTFGIALAFFHHDGNHYSFVGLANFVNILASHGYRITEPLSFYFTLVVTVGWTLLNLVFQVGLGLWLAILLKDPLLRLKGIYRVLLIIPWAVPNYITALIWKGMFQRQFGAINGFLVALGISPVSWFAHFSTSFAANVATNTWLGFPFMMVVGLGALQSIPQDLYEAAEVDGASKWTQFKKITLPLLRPAMLPAIILGTIWTFNMFNVIYLVSGGEPGGATDILISDAYRWAFERNEQYGYAAAYSVLIFFVLLGYSWLTKKMTKDAEEIFG